MALNIPARRKTWLLAAGRRFIFNQLALLAYGFFGELNGLYPTAAAIRLYMKRSMDDRAALTITFTYMTTIVLVIAADAFIVGRTESGWAGLKTKVVQT